MDPQVKNEASMKRLTPGCAIRYCGIGGIGLPRGKSGTYLYPDQERPGAVYVQMEDGLWRMPARLVEVCDDKPV